LCDVYNGNTNPPEWHEATLKCLHKKGDATDPNNWRAICLKDMSARLMSGILSARLAKVIQDHGVKTQFGSQPGVGCLDGLFTLRTALTTRRYHNQPTWALFIDLVKAFDTVHHELLFQLLGRYGVPPQLVNAVQIMYKNMYVNLTIGTEERAIPYTIGVQQGDNMAPVLFLFPMQAFAEILEQKWMNEWNLETPEYRFLPTRNVERGRLLGQATKTAGIAFKLFYQLYVDDGVFLFTNKNDLIRGAGLIHDLFASLGLKMHIGRNGGPSKTEVMYFPRSLEPTEYNTINMDENLCVKDGYVTLTRHFKYLGAWVSDTLKDDYELTIRIKKAQAQMGSLRSFFRCPHIALTTKCKVYLAIPVNTMLWGCESWSMNADMQRQMQVFHHRNLRSILGVNMLLVETYHITNETIRFWACNTPCILNIATQRQLNWIGKVARMPEEKIQRQLLMSWTSNPRKPGRPQISPRTTYAQAIHEIIPTSSPIEGAANKWTAKAKDKTTWRNLIKAWWKENSTISNNLQTMEMMDEIIHT
jgi:hypothetical protein